jgi:hypothetical protein
LKSTARPAPPQPRPIHAIVKDTIIKEKYSSDFAEIFEIKLQNQVAAFHDIEP